MMFKDANKCYVCSKKATSVNSIQFCEVALCDYHSKTWVSNWPIKDQIKLMKQLD